MGRGRLDQLAHRQVQIVHVTVICQHEDTRRIDLDDSAIADIVSEEPRHALIGDFEERDTHDIGHDRPDQSDHRRRRGRRLCGRLDLAGRASVRRKKRPRQHVRHKFHQGLRIGFVETVSVTGDETAERAAVAAAGDGAPVPANISAAREAARPVNAIAIYLKLADAISE
jgi:hypothetical protein